MKQLVHAMFRLAIALAITSAMFAHSLTAVVDPVIRSPAESSQYEPVYAIWNEESASWVPPDARVLNVAGLPPEQFGLIKQFEKLETLQLGNRFDSPPLTVEALTEVAKLKGLKRIDASFIPAFQADWLQALAKCPDLEELNLESGVGRFADDPEISIASLGKIVKSTGLKALDITNCKFTGDFEALLAIANSLEHLAVTVGHSQFKLDAKQLASLGAASLSCLQLETGHVLDDSFFAALARNESLTALSLKGQRNVTPAQLKRLSEVEHLQTLVLDLSNGPLTDEHLIAVSEMSGLTALQIICGRAIDGRSGKPERWDKKVTVTPAGLGKLARLPKLATLDLGDFKAVSDESLALLAESSSIRVLDISKSNGWTAKGIAALSKLETLNELFLDGWGDYHDSPVNDEVLTALTQLKSLHILSLNFTVGVTPTGIAALGKMTSLLALHVTGCGWMNFEACDEISKLPKLRELLMYDVSGIDTECVKALSASPTIEVLGLYGCAALDKAALPHLEKFVALKLVDLRRTGLNAETLKDFIARMSERSVTVPHY